MLTASLASCANDQNEDKPKTTGDSTNKEDEDAPKFVDADYDGKKIKFLYSGETEGDYVDTCILADDVTGGAIGDAVTERSRLVDERYNVKLAAEACDPIGEASVRMQAGSAIST